MTTSPRDLIRQGLEHDERMTPAGELWKRGDIGVYADPMGDEDIAHARGPMIRRAEGDAYHDGAYQKQAKADSHGIAWLRNNARALLTGYAAALDESERNMEMARVASHARDVARARLAEMEREFGFGARGGPPRR